MSVVVRMEMPEVCLTKDGHHGNCLMDRLWCIQKNAPNGMTTSEAYAAMTEAIPSWCPIICQLPKGHGRLVDADELRREMYHEAFETDTDMQKWDSGCWIRYKMFENTIGAVPTIVPAEAERSET